MSKWSDRPGYVGTAETSMYVEKTHRGRGIGKKLLKELVREGRQNGLHALIAQIVEGNEASLSLADREGFQHVGVLREASSKFGRLLDVHVLQKIYSA